MHCFSITEFKNTLDAPKLAKKIHDGIRARNPKLVLKALCGSLEAAHVFGTFVLRICTVFTEYTLTTLLLEKRLMREIVLGRIRKT